MKAVLLNLLEYHWVEDIDDALILLSSADTKTVPLAGGTYLLGYDDEHIQAVVDLRDLNLAYIREDAKGVHIGAMTTLQMMADAPVLRDLAAGLLARAAQASSPSRLIRNSATLGGTLAIGAASHADLLTALAAIEAVAQVRSGTKSQIGLGADERPGLALTGVTFTGKQERRLSTLTLTQERRPNELIIEAIIPRLSYRFGASFQRIVRTSSDLALLNAAAVVELTGDSYSHVRLALGGVNMEPVRLREVEQHLEGQPAMNADSDTINTQLLVSALQAGIADFRPPPDMRASSGYRRTAAINLAFRTLEEAVTISRRPRMASSQERQ